MKLQNNLRAIGTTATGTTTTTITTTVDTTITTVTCLYYAILTGNVSDQRV